MWINTSDYIPDNERQVIIAYIGYEDDIEYAIAEYLSEDFEFPKWRTYISSDNASTTIDINYDDVLMWAEFDLPTISKKIIEEFDLQGKNVNRIIDH